MTGPLWASSYLPIEDLPQHLAAMRVLHSFHVPSFEFERYFELQLLRTQYLGYYLVVDALAYVLELERANQVVMIACLAATPLALAYLMRALDRDPALALFALPLTYNAHLILGFINFLMAIPAAFLGLGLCARQCRQVTRTRGVLLALVATFCFFCHVVPFAFLVLGCGLLAARRDLRSCARILAPLSPSVLIGGAWLLQSPAGQATLTAAQGGAGAEHAIYQPAAVSYRDLPNWLLDVVRDPECERWLQAFVLLLALTIALGLGRALYQRALPRSRLYLRLWLLAPLAALLYFVLPSGYAWIWPIAQRFPLLALLWLIPVLPRPPRLATYLIALALLCLSARERFVIERAFTAFAAEEVGALDAALAVIPEGRRVMGLIFRPGSRYVKFTPFMHYVAYYQARKGGAVMFTFADFPQSPFRFRQDARPPRVPPRWEWLPQRVRPSDLGWYEYVLVRGPGDPCRGACELRFRQGLWSVWRQRS